MYCADEKKLFRYGGDEEVTLDTDSRRFPEVRAAQWPCQAAQQGGVLPAASLEGHQQARSTYTCKLLMKG